MNIGLLIIGVLFLYLFFGTSSKSQSVSVNEVYSNFKNDIQISSFQRQVPVKRITAIIIKESSGDKDAIGQSGEIGLMQLTEGAIEDVNQFYGTSFSKGDMFNASSNIFVGTSYLAFIRDKYFNGNLDIATQAYNVGWESVKVNPSLGLGYLTDVKRIESTISIS